VKHRRTAPTLMLVALGVALSACGGMSTGSSGSSVAESTTVTVFAASSLKGSFSAIGAAFEADNPGVTVTFNFGPSSGLATQITQGAPADVFASASQKTMDAVSAASLAVSPQVFAVNSLAIATPVQQSVEVLSLADLAKPGVKVAVCQKVVPCGAAAHALFEQNKLSVTPSTEEVDVKAVLTKVQLGEVDAGVVYVTDVKSAQGSVTGIIIPAEYNVTTRYPIAALLTSSGSASATATDFVDYVLSPAGQQVLLSAGFVSP